MSEPLVYGLFLALFLVTAGLGLGLYRRSRRHGRWLPGWGLAHAGLGLAALTGLIGLAVSVGDNRWLNSAALFLVLAAIGGGFAWLVRSRSETPILPIVLLHAAAALMGVLLLLGALLGARGG